MRRPPLLVVLITGLAGQPAVDVEAQWHGFGISKQSWPASNDSAVQLWLEKYIAWGTVGGRWQCDGSGGPNNPVSDCACGGVALVAQGMVRCPNDCAPHASAGVRRGFSMSATRGASRPAFDNVSAVEANFDRKLDAMARTVNEMVYATADSDDDDDDVGWQRDLLVYDAFADFNTGFFVSRLSPLADVFEVKVTVRVHEWAMPSG